MLNRNGRELRPSESKKEVAQHQSGEVEESQENHENPMAEVNQGRETG